MLNSLATYHHVGAQCGRAMKRRDEATRRFHSDWFSRALRHEAHSDRPVIEAAFNNGYLSETRPHENHPAPL